jgi:coproporphyrinogen III oxidase
MNTRFLCTTKRWFGGGADLNPPIPYDEDTAEFHAVLKAACDAHDPEHYPRFKAMGRRLFLHPPPQGPSRRRRDLLRSSRRRTGMPNFAFTQDVGRAFLDVFPRIVRRRMGMAFTEADKAQQLEWRGRYAEFNLIYDRGTLFGLKTGGNVDAILMSLPPVAAWG